MSPFRQSARPAAVREGMTLLSNDAIDILRVLVAAPGPIDRSAAWPSAAWYELLAAGLVRSTEPPLPRAQLSRWERRFEAQRLLLRMRLGPERVAITERGRLRLARIDAGRRRAG